MADVLQRTILCEDEDAHDELLLKQKQFLGECKKKQLHVEAKLKKNTANATVLTQLNHLRGQYVELKNSTRYQQSLLLTMQELSTRDKENSPEDTDAAIQAKKKTSAANVQSLKNELHDSKTHIEELADTAEQYYAEYQTLLGQMEKRVQLAEEKRGRIIQKQEEVKRRLAALGSNICTKENTDVSVQKKTEECASVQAALQAVQQALAVSDALLPKLKAECRDLQVEIEDVKSFLNNVRTAQKTVRQSTHAQIRWCEAVEDLLETVSEVRETNITGSSVTLQLSRPLSPLQQQQCACTITIHVCLTSSASYKLQTAQVSPDTLDVTDIIATAVTNNDIRYLVYEVQAVWERHMPLWQEIETLREKFALDWLHCENLLTVLFGSEASIVVRLHIDPGYPASGDVSLLSAVGLPEGTTVSQLQLPNPSNNSLTDWLEYLGRTLQPTVPVPGSNP